MRIFSAARYVTHGRLKALSGRWIKRREPFRFLEWRDYANPNNVFGS